jgi:hypothetical protein
MTNEVPPGFIELTCVGSEGPIHLQVESIAGYGPHSTVNGEFVGCPVQLKGQSWREAQLVRQTLSEIAQLCIVAKREAP